MEKSIVVVASFPAPRHLKEVVFHFEERQYRKFQEIQILSAHL